MADSKYRLTLSLILLCVGIRSGEAAMWPFVSREEARREALVSGRAAMEDEIYSLARGKLEFALEKSETIDEKIEAAIPFARALRGAGDLELAQEVLRRLANRASESRLYAAYLSELAYLQFDLAEYESALESLGTNAEGAGEDVQAANARLLPKVHVKLGQRKAALEAFAEFNRKYPNRPDAPANMLEWAGVLSQAKQLEEAIALLRQAADIYTDTRAAWTARVWEAQILLRLQRWDEARQLLTEIVADPQGPAEIRAEAHFYLARVYEHRREIDRAVEQLLKIEELGIPEEALQQGRVFRGKLLFISGREEEGLELVHAAIRANPQDPEVAATQLDMADLLLDQERPEMALREYQYYLETFETPKGLADALLGKGWAHYLLEQYGEAALMFRKAMEALPSGKPKLEALYKSADSYFQARMYKEALDIYNMGISMYADSEETPEMMFQSAEALRRLDRVGESLERLSALEQRYPAGDAARKSAVKRARIEEERREWDRAIEVYTEISKRYSGSALALEAIHNRAIIYYRLSRFAHAIEDFEQLLASGGDSAIVQRAFFMRGWCYYLIGEEDKALEICNEFLRKYPDSQWSQDVKFWICNHLFNKGRYAEAETEFAGLAKDYPDGQLAGSALFWAAQSAIKQKEYLRAIEHLGRLIENYPDHKKIDEARFAQGDALSALGKFSEAILVFEAIVKKRQGGGEGEYFVMRAWGRMGDCNFTLGSDKPERYNRAIACYDRILTKPGSAAALKLQSEFKIGRCLEKLDQSDQAFERYMNVVYEHLKERKRGETGAALWFTKAAFGAAQIAETREKWRQAINIYQRVLDADVAAAAEAQKRIRRIRLDHWILF